MRTYSNKTEVVGTIARSVPEVGGNRNLERTRTKAERCVVRKAEGSASAKGSLESVASKCNVMRRCSSAIAVDPSRPKVTAQ